MEKSENTGIVELTEKSIQSRIYFVRGQKVMPDFELAEIYGYETKYFNRQVKNNIDKFPGISCFVLRKMNTVTS